MNTALQRTIASILLMATFTGCLDTPAQDHGEEERPSRNAGKSDDIRQEGSRQHSSQGESWTYMIYMMADNDLEQYALDDLREMASVGSTDAVNIVVLADRSPNYTSEGVLNLEDWEDTRYIHVQKDHLEVVQQPGELDLGDPSTLSEFISWSQQNYPADRYAISFWDHGGSWNGGFGPDETTLEEDASKTGTLYIADLQTAFEQAMLANEDLKEFAFIGFDTCLLGTASQILAMKPYGEYLLASEELEPGKGWDYSAIEVLTSNPRASGADLGKAMLERFATHHEEPWITLSLIDLYALDTLEQALLELFDTLNKHVEEHAVDLARVRHRLKTYGAPSEQWNTLSTVDIGQLVTELAREHSAYLGHEQAVLQGLRQAVVDQVRGPAASEAHGIAIYFPQYSNYYDANYQWLPVPELSLWTTWVAAYMQYGPRGDMPRFAEERDAISVVEDGVLMRLEGQIVEYPEALTSATLPYGYFGREGYLSLVGENPVEVDLQTGQVSGQWDGSFLEIVQGDIAAPVYFKQTRDANGITRVDIPAYYMPPGEEDINMAREASIVYTIDEASEEEHTNIFVTTKTGTRGELVVEPGARLLPCIYEMELSTNQKYLVGSSEEWIDLSKPYGFKLASYNQVEHVMLLEIYGVAGLSDILSGVLWR